MKTFLSAIIFTNIFTLQMALGSSLETESYCVTNKTECDKLISLEESSKEHYKAIQKFQEALQPEKIVTKTTDKTKSQSIQFILPIDHDEEISDIFSRPGVDSTKEASKTSLLH